jgi:hypothetical protein
MQIDQPMLMQPLNAFFGFVGRRGHRSCAASGNRRRRGDHIPPRSKPVREEN